MSEMCPVRKKIADEQLEHEPEYTYCYYEIPEYTDCYYEIPDRLIGMMYDDEVENFWKDAEAERQWKLGWTKRFEEHITTCEHPSCKVVKSVYIKEKCFEVLVEWNSK